MSAVTSDDYARQWSLRLVETEMRRSGLTATAARVKVASRLGASAGTLENLNRHRLKGVREWLFSRLHEAVVAEVEREMAALHHEHETLMALGRRADPVAVQEVATSLARLRATLAGEDSQ